MRIALAVALLALAGCDRRYLLRVDPADAARVDASALLDARAPDGGALPVDAGGLPDASARDAGRPDAAFDPAVVEDTLGVRVRLSGPEPRSEPGSPDPLYCIDGAMHPSTWTTRGQRIMTLCPALHAMPSEVDVLQCRPIRCRESVECFSGMLPCVDGVCMAPFNVPHPDDVRAWCLRDRPRPTECAQHREHVRDVQRLTDGPVGRQCTGEFGPCSEPPWDCTP